MSLTLSSSELTLLGHALAITSAPLAYARTSDWRAAVRHAIEPLLGADKSVSALGVEGEPLLESPAEDVSAWNIYLTAGFADERGDRRIGRRGPEVAHMAMVHDVPALRRSELYNEFVRPYAMFHPVSIQLVVAGTRAPAQICFFHASESVNPFGEEAVAILDLVRPVFRASVEVLAGLRPTLRGHAYSELVDVLPDAAALCSSSGKLLHESPSLTRLLATEPLAGRVRAAIAAAARALARHGEAGVRKSATPLLGIPAAFEVHGASTRYAVRGSLLALSNDHPARAATIVLVCAAPPRARSDAELRERFALTAREVEVSRLLAAGCSARDVASSLGISYFTARHHVEHVLAKLGVQSRAAVAAALDAAPGR